MIRYTRLTCRSRRLRQLPNLCCCRCGLLPQPLSMESSYPWKYHFHCKSRLPNLLLLTSLTDLPRYSYSSRGVFTCLAGAETWTPGGPSRQRVIDKKHYPEPPRPTIRTRINRPCARMPELALFVRSDVSLFPLLFILGRGGFF